MTELCAYPNCHNPVSGNCTFCRKHHARLVEKPWTSPRIYEANMPNDNAPIKVIEAALRHGAPLSAFRFITRPLTRKNGGRCLVRWEIDDAYRLTFKRSLEETFKVLW